MKTTTLTKRSEHLALSLIAGLAITLSPTATLATPGSPITWNAATNISGDTDVSTVGTTLAAFNLGDSGGALAVTVNGVNFTPFVIAGNPTTVGNFTLQESPAGLLGGSTFGSASTPYANLSANYQTLLNSAAYANESGTITLTMNNLTVSQQYLFEWWNNDSTHANYNTTATDTNSVTLNDNTTNVAGGEGQFATGTFTANASTVTISFTGIPNGPAINAFQLRVVPEPSSTMLILSVSLLSFVRRRRSRES